MKRFLKKTLKGTFATALGLGVLEVLVSAGNCSVIMYDRINPSKERQEFYDVYGIHIDGDGSQFEDKPQDRSALADAIAREQQFSEVPVKTIKFEYDSFLRKTPWEQFTSMLHTPHSGYCKTQHNFVLTSPSDIEGTTHHEMAHARVVALGKDKHELKKKWKALMVDENGESLYLTAEERRSQRNKWIEDIVPEEKKDSDLNLRLGFTSNYARTHVNEDIAELAEYIHHDYDIGGYRMAELLYGSLKDGIKPVPVVRQKVELLQDFGIIPAEYLEYMDMREAPLRALWLPDTDEEKTLEDSYSYQQVQYMYRSQQFLEDHSGSIYAPLVHLARADYLIEKAFVVSSCYEDIQGLGDDLVEIYLSDPQFTGDLICKMVFDLKISPTSFGDELEATLNAPYVSMGTRVDTLGVMWKHILRKDISLDVSYKETEDVLTRRYDRGDITLPQHGINDYLEEQGVFEWKTN